MSMTNRAVRALWKCLSRQNGAGLLTYFVMPALIKLV